MTNNTVQLSDHFWLHEFLVSETAARAGHVLVPSEEVIVNLTRLCRTVLEPLRSRSNRPFIVHSGYRDEWLNNAVGGAKNSAHLTGRAADIIAHGMRAEIFSRWCAYQGDIAFDKVIDEFYQWTHVQCAKVNEKPRNEFWWARRVEGKTIYTPGEV